MKDLCFVTGNQNKFKEVKKLVKTFNLISLNDLNFFDEIQETDPSIKGNAFIKANFIHKKYNLDCFSDDTGLFIDCLDGEPGVRSARYAGDNSSSDDNIKLVLNKLKFKKNRFAHFQTIICLILYDKIEYFEGIIGGKITKTPLGDHGFGYDPIFMPMDSNKTFAQFSLEEKNKVSHRAIATRKLITYLNNFNL
tara:strand:+ start:81 stop:662 length:582 start_codon:yes stop_codon:yes gene_type:complete